MDKITVMPSIAPVAPHATPRWRPGRQ